MGVAEGPRSAFLANAETEDAETYIMTVASHGNSEIGAHLRKADIVLYLFIGFSVCLVSVWIYKWFQKFIFGTGQLKGKKGPLPANGFFIQTSRGQSHCLLYKCTPTDRVSSSNDQNLNARDFECESSERSTSIDNDLDTDIETGLDVKVTTKRYMVSESAVSSTEYHNLIVLIHGFGGSSSVFYNRDESDYVRLLQDSGRDVLVFDNYGHGYSEGPDIHYDAELFAEQLNDICQTLKISEPFDLLGFSLGASVAVCFAYRYPNLVQRLILQAPSIAETSMRLDLQLALRVPVVREVAISMIVPRLGNGACRENPAVIRASYRLLQTRLRGNGGWTSTMSGEDQGTLAMLKHISRYRRTPILCLWGAKDAVVPCSESAKVLEMAPCLRLVVHADATHDCFAQGANHVRDFFISNIVSFLEEPVGFDYQYHALKE